ncbi:MAG: DUF423 domain-containing protein [Colwelliaceae bacterium]|jgi:uncharacterized membrane protein YgdD (TMEM256/DUF423 family)|nr:DUF423 domain-containing protein [Colwelliaceae bacterium]
MKLNAINKIFIGFAALSGAFSVLFGAWLAHASSNILEIDKARLITAHHYQIIHTLALLIVTLAYRVKTSRALFISATCFVVGILLFSGSLYLKTYTGIASLGILAPFGGITLALGWLSLVLLGNEKS